MLLGNYSVLNKTNGRFLTGSTTGDHAFLRSNFNKLGMQRNKFNCIEQACYSAIPNGYIAPTAWMFARKSGGMAAYTNYGGSGSCSSVNLAGGLNAESTINGIADLTATLILLVFATSSISSDGNITGDISGLLPAESSITGTSSITSDLGALVGILADLSGSAHITSAEVISVLLADAIINGSSSLVADPTALLEAESVINGTSSLNIDITGLLPEFASSISGSGTIVANILSIAHMVSTLIGNSSLDITSSAIGDMSADITPFTELSPQSLAAAIWNSVASAYNESGTLGEKLNAAGGAADPWGTELPGTYLSGTAGDLIGNNLDAKISEIVQNIWNESTDGYVTTETFGKLMKDIETLTKQVKNLTLSNQ